MKYMPFWVFLLAIAVGLPIRYAVLGEWTKSYPEILREREVAKLIISQKKEDAQIQSEQ